MKKIIWIIVLVIIVAGVIWVASKKGPLSPSGASPTPTATPKAGSSSYKGTSSGPTSQQSQTYTQLVNQYSGHLIQFNDICQAIPGQLAVKKGTKVMLDNRSAVAKMLLLDGTTVSLPAYSYSIVTMTTSKALPYDLGIDCRSVKGAGENTATVEIQAAILQLIK